MSELITLEKLKQHFKVIKVEDTIVFLKLHRGQYIINVEMPFKANEKIASLLGHVLGDGCIKQGEENVYYTNKSKDLADEFRMLVKGLFGIYPNWNFNKEREFYEIYPPKTVARFLVLCGFPKGEKVKQALTIPEWIKNGSLNIKSAFIRALFDDEGTVINSKGNYVIGFSMNKKNFLLNAHKKFMEDIRGILLSLGISPNGLYERKQPYDSTSIGFNIYGRYNLMKFIETVGFTDNKKKGKLVQTINSYKTYGKGESKMRILDALKMGSVLRTKDLCRIVNRNRDVIWKNVHKLVEEGLVEKSVISKRGPIETVNWKLKNNINPNTKF
ncbi:MAG: hypothetical protein HYT70_04185 [Candidatus Aenigmarchaeota archaeon]|nr:hypothetical protein [Candidatus Aenigmarchaeota archaeon]